MFDNFTKVTCCSCFADFGMNAEQYKVRQTDHKTFWCPACGTTQHFAGMSEKEKLRQENQRLKQNAAYKDDQIKAVRERADREQHTARAYKGQCTKLKKRAKAGVCPCCNRMFMNMQAHMATKHPKFDPEEPLKLVKESV